jgi:hypothetical protein
MSRGVIHLKISRWLGMGLVVLFLVPWICLLVLITNGRKAVPKQASLSTTEPFSKAKHGPWGEVVYKRIYLEPPEDFIPIQQFSQDQLKWTLKNCSFIQLKKLFAEAELNASQIESILQNSKEDESTKGFILFPQDSFIIDLKPEQRSVLYTALSGFEENFYQYYPTCISTEEFSTPSKLISDETENNVRKLQYHRGNSILFSDFDILRKVVKSDIEFAEVLKKLCRKPTVVMRIRVDENTDINALARYWGRGGREKIIYPIIEGMAQSKGESLISALSLLPPFARVRAYTYPLPSDSQLVAREDCFWTCMNFFNEVPNPKFTDSAQVREALARDYYPVETQPLLGDLVFFIKANGETVHGAVYIADGIVFTKNGPTSVTPWTFMTLSDLIVNYPSSEKLIVRVYRPKNLSDHP